MQDNLEQHLDDFTKKVMQSSSLEQPSLDFTAQLMSKVNASTSKTVYQPLISKRTWFIIAICLIGFVIYLFLGSDIKSIGWFDSIDLSVLSSNKISETLSSFTFKVSNTVVYAIVFFGLAFLLQISLIKKLHNRRFSY